MKIHKVKVLLLTVVQACRFKVDSGTDFTKHVEGLWKMYSNNKDKDKNKAT